jgi:hypothetical protein
MKQRIHRPSPALVISLIALFLAAGGSAYALSVGKNTIGTKQIKKRAIKGVDVKKNTLTGKEINEAKLNFATSKAVPDFHTATLQNGWTRFGSDWSVTGYWFDENGFVHIQGALSGGTNPTVFTLPADARPKTFRSFVVRCSGAAGTGVVEISPSTGNVNLFSQGGSNCASYGFLDGIDFRPDIP